MLSIPTAPFAEHLVTAYLKDRLGGHRCLTFESDRSGNLLVRFKRGKRRIAKPIALTAHLDHPGFLAASNSKNGTVTADWHGGVEPDYFPGAGVRFHKGGRWIRGNIKSVTLDSQSHKKRPGVKSVKVAVQGDVTAGAIGMWDLPEPAIRGQRISARGCDDIAGVCAIVAAIDRLVASRKSGEAYFLFTRAEEVGFVGAIAAARSGLLPKRCGVVAVECSSERVNAKMGDGPILRVGDAATTFSAGLTQFASGVAAELARRHKTFKHQRKLMDGGTCESTAYCEYGYDATGLCVALGHYHNRDVQKKRIASEYIHLGDWAMLVHWFVALINASGNSRGQGPGIRRRIDDNFKDYVALLRATAQ
jgi:endoglucanase